MVSFCLLVAATLGPQVNPHWEFAYENGDDIWVATADGRHRHELIHDGRSPKWSPDGKRIAYARGREIRIRDLATKAERVVYRLSAADMDDEGGGDGYPQTWIDWDPKRPVLLVSTEYTKTIKVVLIRPKGQWSEMTDYDRPAGDSGGILEGTIVAPTYFADWSPSGRWMAFVKAGDLWLACRGSCPKDNRIDLSDYYDTDTRLAALAQFHDHDGSGDSAWTPNFVTEMDWTQDEKRIVFVVQRVGGSGIYDIGYVDVNPKTLSDYVPPYQLHQYIAEGLCPRICPDGRTLSYAAQDGGGGDWNLYISDWSGKLRRLVMRDVDTYDWKPK